jgi:LAO/AO transport system kinase
MLHMGPELEWTPPIVPTTATSGAGVDDLWEAVERHRKHLEATGLLERKRRERILKEVEEMVLARLRRRMVATLEEGALEELGDDLMARRVDPYRATDILLARLTPTEERG